MDPRRKMKCVLDFRKSHADVFWLRFGDQQTASNYLVRLQRRIDAQAQPSVLERITNAFRRRRQSPDVFWLRFGDQQTASNYLVRLQRRIDAQAQPSVLERITNAFRRRRQSPGKHRFAINKSGSPTRTATNEAL
ncbi:hypothetical protein AHF37_06681 [Paragonimus kellicotti]|nr:hypothetical protein AHF37_06681 [Paragonimus kellicotti]